MINFWKRCLLCIFLIRSNLQVIFVLLLCMGNPTLKMILYHTLPLWGLSKYQIRVQYLHNSVKMLKRLKNIFMDKHCFCSFLAKNVPLHICFMVPTWLNFDWHQVRISSLSCKEEKEIACQNSVFIHHIVALIFFLFLTHQELNLMITRVYFLCHGHTKT